MRSYEQLYILELFLMLQKKLEIFLPINIWMINCIFHGSTKWPPILIWTFAIKAHCFAFGLLQMSVLYLGILNWHINKLSLTMLMLLIYHFWVSNIIHSKSLWSLFQLRQFLQKQEIATSWTTSYLPPWVTVNVKDTTV